MKKYIRLVPGEPVPQFGGMTPEQFGTFAGKLEGILLMSFGSCDGAMTMYSHLAARLFLDVEHVAGQAAMEEAINAFIVALRDEVAGQRKLRASIKDVEPETNGNSSGGLH